ncbi:MAG: type II toxin-antitoxin system RelE/ParE family toxin [Caulobacteraceae bacterium]
MRLAWLPAAVQNRFDQLDFVARENPSAAISLDEAIERHTDRLALYPNLGREGRVAGTRELVIPRTPFIAVYRLGPDQVEILRLLHGAQRWPRSG